MKNCLPDVVVAVWVVVVEVVVGIVGIAAVEVVDIEAGIVVEVEVYRMIK